MGILFFALGIAALSMGAVFAFKNRHHAPECIASITLGILFSTFFMVLPTEWVKEGKEVFCAPLYKVLSSLLYSLKALSGRQDIAQLQTVSLPKWLKEIYIVINYIAFELAPILASGLIISFVGDIGERMRLLLQFSPKCYVFSEINENSLALAAGIQKKPGKKTMVFCNGKNIDHDTVEKAKSMGGIVLHKPCDNFKIRKRFKSYEFCLISTNEDKNILLAETIVHKHANDRKAKIIINAFVESGTNVNFLESAVKNGTGSADIELRCIDEIALFCNHLIFNHPLYRTKDINKTISVAIIGCGRTGMRMLKTAYWAGQIYDHTLKIRVYDKNADDRQSEFYRQCPGLKDEKAIKFVNADVSKDTFKDHLLDSKNSDDATYIVVAMDNDQMNLSIAEELYRIYRQHFNFQEDRMPEIFTRVRSQVKSGAYDQNMAFLEKRHIHLFGSTASVFSDKTLFDTELENLAFAVHLAYQGKLQLDPKSPEYAKIRKEFCTSEYDRRSSMAVALHIPAKLSICNMIPQTDDHILTAENIKLYIANTVHNPLLCHRLAVNEHHRWNAFMLSEGYQSATIQQMHQYAEAVGNHKDDLSMLHPCITEWKELDKLEQEYNSTYGKSKEFKKYDIEIVEKIPEIWEVAQRMNGENGYV